VYLSDAYGRRVTPKIVARAEYLKDSSLDTHDRHVASNLPRARGRGRPPKNDPEREARSLQNRWVVHKKRIGGPGMDRGGATLANEKRRRGFMDNDDDEEEFVQLSE